jgi:hypothetical protein
MLFLKNDFYRAVVRNYYALILVFSIVNPKPGSARPLNATAPFIPAPKLICRVIE